MYEIQYNVNTFKPNLRRRWLYACRADSLAQAYNLVIKTKREFCLNFGFPSRLDYRIRLTTPHGAKVVQIIKGT